MATPSSIGGINFYDLDQDIVDALNAATAPTGANEFATVADVAAGAGMQLSYTQFASLTIGPAQPDIVINPGFTPKMVIVESADSASDGNHMIGRAVGTAAGQQGLHSSGAFVNGSIVSGLCFSVTRQAGPSIVVTGTCTSFTSANVTIGSWVNVNPFNGSFAPAYIFVTIIG